MAIAKKLSDPRISEKEGGIGFFMTAGETASEAPKKNKPTKSFKILIMVGALLLLIGGGVAGWILFTSQAQEGMTFLGRIKDLWASEKTSSPIHGHIYRVEPFVVNLADSRQLRYLKITLHVESDREKASEDFEKRLPQLRDAILTILTSKSYKEIMSAEGKTALREEIKGKLNHLPIRFKVQSIYFTEFVIQ